MKFLLLIIFSIISSISFLVFSYFMRKNKKFIKLESKIKDFEINFEILKILALYSISLIIFNTFIFILLSISLGNFYIVLPKLEYKIPWQLFFAVLCFAFTNSLKNIIEIL